MLDQYSATTPAARTVAFVLKGYPRLSETFIAQEILALEKTGLPIQIIAMRHPTEPEVHPVHREIRAPVHYLPEYLYQEPGRVLRAWWRQRRLPGYRLALAQFLRDLRHDFSRNRARRFGQALVLAEELPASIGHLHAHFLHAPASVTRYVSLLTGLPWSCSAHAKDIWTQPQAEIRSKLGHCDWLVTCTEANRAYLASLAPRAGQVELVYHGLDLSRLPPPPRRATSDGSDPAHPVALLSVGRAVPKKGFAVLLDALARLDPQLHWRWTHVGGGKLLAPLQAQARALGLDERIRWLGPMAQEAVIGQYRAADLFVLPSQIQDDGDRDGLPNVLMEAMSQGLACVSTAISGIPELIEDRVSGRLVAQRDPGQLAEAIAELIRDPSLRQRLGEAADRHVRQGFAMQAGIERLAAKFGLPRAAA